MTADFYLQAPVQKTTVGVTRYAWRKFGEGPPLLLVHGFPLSGFTWRKVLPGLARHYTCYVPDLPGLGETEWSEQSDFSWHGQAAGLKGLIDQIGLPGYHLMGHDTGGTFARCLALADGARVSKLVIVNSEIPGHRPPWIPLYQALMYLPGTLTAFRVLLRSRAFLRSGMGFGGCFHDLSLIDGEFHERFVAPLLREPERMRGLQLYLRSLKWNVVDGFLNTHARLGMPVQLVWGADDPTFPLEPARRMVREFPHCGLSEIPGAKLFVHEEKPAEVVRATLEFLQR